MFSLARHWTLNDVCPNYVKVPPSLLEIDGTLAPPAAVVVFRAAADALEKRRLGLRNYIAWFEAELRRLSG